MSQIWNGSYTLGDSQETQITAGSGIKVTTPAAGQIQISKDETVLWEDLTNTTQLYSGSTSFDLSESYLNFDIIKVYYRHSFSGNMADCSEGVVIPNENFRLGVGGRSQGDNAWTLIDRAMFAFNTTNPTKCSVTATSRAGIQISGTTITVKSDNNGIIPIRIVGINRK